MKKSNDLFVFSFDVSLPLNAKLLAFQLKFWHIRGKMRTLFCLSVQIAFLVQLSESSYIHIVYKVWEF